MSEVRLSEPHLSRVLAKILGDGEGIEDSCRVWSYSDGSANFKQVAAWLADWLGQELANELRPEPEKFEDIGLDHDKHSDIIASYPMARSYGLGYATHFCSDEGPKNDYDTVKYQCTREPNHEGPHVAHLDPGEACAWWPKETAQ